MFHVHSYIKENLSLKVIDRISLAYQDRYIRKKILFSKKNKILVNFSTAVYLPHNSFLVTEKKQAIQIIAKKEKIIHIDISNPVKRCEVAWHIGNRHLAAQINKSAICILYDPVIWKMLVKLGYKVKKESKIFQPLAGAYDHQH